MIESPLVVEENCKECMYMTYFIDMFTGEQTPACNVVNELSEKENISLKDILLYEDIPTWCPMRRQKQNSPD